MIRVGLFEDQELIRQGLHRLLELALDMRVTGQADSFEQGLRVAAGTELDVALVDVRFPDGTGMDLLRAWRQAPSAPRVLMLTTFPDDVAMLECLQLGARGFLLKDISLQDLLRAVRFVHDGGTLTNPSADRLLNPHPKQAQEQFALTERERQTLTFLRTGMTNRELAAAQQVTEGTIKNRVSSILRKMGVRDRAAAIIKSLDND